MLTLSELYIYPIKSLGGIALREALVERRGLQYDRRWMLVDAQGRFVSQREVPAMTQLGTAIEGGQLRIFVKKNPADYLDIPLEEGILFKTRVSIWSDKCTALEYPLFINEWFSDQLNFPVRLVSMPDTTRRQADGRYAPKGQYVSFADGFPFLIIGQASLDDLNQRLPDALPTNRFRPNLVFTGGKAYEEDNWTDFQVGHQAFRGVKPCGRCTIITTDQDSGAIGKEPLRTLAQYRSQGNKVLFGQNVIWMGGDNNARIAIGDKIVVGK